MTPPNCYGEILHALFGTSSKTRVWITLVDSTTEAYTLEMRSINPKRYLPSLKNQSSFS